MPGVGWFHLYSQPPFDIYNLLLRFGLCIGKVVVLYLYVYNCDIFCEPL